MKLVAILKRYGRIVALAVIPLVASLWLWSAGIAFADGPGVDIATRNATYVYVFEVPPARGISPSLGLKYYGPGGKDYLNKGWWMVGFPFIEWDQLAYYNYHKLFEGNYYQDMWELEREGGGDSTGRYHRESEDFKYYYFDQTASKWTVIDKDGTKYAYGSTDNSRVTYVRVDPILGAYDVKRWYLDTITDTNGNTISITYDISQRATTHVIYPSQLKWNNDQLRVVNFGWEARSDYSSGDPYYYTWRLQNVDVLANGSRVRQYKLAYDASNRLSAITQYDTGGIAGNVSLPATQFTYEAAGLLSGVTESAGARTTVTYVSAGADPVDSRVTKYIQTVTQNNGLVSTDPLYTSSSSSYRFSEDYNTGTDRVVVKDDSSGNETGYVYELGKAHPVFKGRLLLVTARKGNWDTGPTLRELDFQWNFRDIGTLQRVEFGYIQNEGETTYDEANQANRKSKYRTYTYDGYGNVSIVTVYQDNSSPWVAEKYLKTDYVYNVPAGDPKSTYIVSTPKQTYATDAANAELAKTRFYYDGLAFGAAPTKGNLTKKEGWIEGDQALASSWSSTAFSYYANGNVQTITDPNGKPTTFEYDVTYSTFPTKTVNALGYVTRATYDGGTGQLATLTDANNKTTTYTYDLFKRPEKVIGPLDSSTYPTIRYQYAWASVPRMTAQSQRTDAYATATYLDTYTFVDGFGRTIQTKTPAEDTTKQIQVDARTRYDSTAARWVSEEFVPYLVTLTAGYNASPDVTRQKTRTEFDARGQPVKVTRPDGSYSTNTHGYDWTVTAKGYKPDGAQISESKSYYDGEGRLVRLEQKNNYDVNGNPVTPDATFVTQYQYDLMGNLLRTTDPSSYATTQTYDRLGRVKGKTDPNTGAWSFTYDPAGNLTRSTDARNQIITFTYDALNRIIGKSVP